mmetsp:Transcript_7810/g.34789  ORF Transcript_7810/g.34789 Transcript_7810/m.34789 type:complete len:98 (-) Transcript_7810:230-523(-)
MPLPVRARASRRVPSTVDCAYGSDAKGSKKKSQLAIGLLHPLRSNYLMADHVPFPIFETSDKTASKNNTLSFEKQVISLREKTVEPHRLSNILLLFS